MSRDYLTSEDILAIHSVLLKNYGGAEGIRDKGLLEAASSALNRDTLMDYRSGLL